MVRLVIVSLVFALGIYIAFFWDGNRMSLERYPRMRLIVNIILYLIGVWIWVEGLLTPWRVAISKCFNPVLPSAALFLLTVASIVYWVIIIPHIRRRITHLWRSI